MISMLCLVALLNATSRGLTISCFEFGLVTVALLDLKLTQIYCPCHWLVRYFSSFTSSST